MTLSRKRCLLAGFEKKLAICSYIALYFTKYANLARISRDGKAVIIWVTLSVGLIFPEVSGRAAKRSG